MYHLYHELWSECPCFYVMGNISICMSVHVYIKLYTIKTQRYAINVTFSSYSLNYIVTFIYCYATHHIPICKDIWTIKHCYFIKHTKQVIKILTFCQHSQSHLQLSFCTHLGLVIKNTYVYWDVNEIVNKGEIRS